MKVSLKTITNLSLVTLAHLSAATAPDALAQTSGVTSSWEINEGEQPLDIKAQRILVDLLIQRIKGEANFRAQYLTDPREAMTEMGIHPAVQREILIEEGLIDVEDVLLEGDCVCTQCCVTSITVG